MAGTHTIDNFYRDAFLFWSTHYARWIDNNYKFAIQASEMMNQMTQYYFTFLAKYTLKPS